MRFDILLGYFVIINLLGAIVNVADKHRARYNKWRIKERTLWLIAFFGGAPLSYITMKKIRHKTKHRAFMFFMPILSIIDIAVMIYVLYQIAKF